jgi:hydrogenase-4 component B
MQYTSSSFAEGLVNLFSFVLWPRTQAPVIERLFPARAAFRSEVPDTVLDRALMPLVNAVVRLLAPLRWFQRGNVQLYLAYIVAAIVVLMLWVGWSA